jgi:hypothetical protein
MQPRAQSVYAGGALGSTLLAPSLIKKPMENFMPDKEKKKVDISTDFITPEHVENPHFPDLRAMPSISLLGPDHDGVMDDATFEFLDRAVEAKSNAPKPTGKGGN